MTNDEAILMKSPGGKGEREFDLAERTARFGEEAIRFARSVKLDAITSPLVRQFVRSATSIGANYCEADESGSKKEFRYRISICVRETRETKHWLRMLAQAHPQGAPQSHLLWKEADELSRIFATIHRRSAPK